MRPILLACSLLLAPLALRAQDIGIPVGSTAPVVALETLEGKPASLAQWIGKTPVVLEFWASWCGECKRLEPKLHKVATRYRGKVQFVAIAVSVNQTVERARKYQQKYKLPMTMLYDRQGLASEAYDAVATSYIVVIDRKGKVVYTGQGGGQDLEAAVRKAM